MLSIVPEAEWALGLVWTTWNISPPPGFFPRTVQPVASHCTDYAIPARHGTARPCVQKYGPQFCGAYVDWCMPSSLACSFLLLSTKCLIGKSEDKRKLGRSRRRLEDNIKVEVR